MKFQIVFDQTGDSIPFVSVNDQILEFYVNHLASQNLNTFELLSQSSSADISHKIRALDTSIKENNQLIKVLLDQTVELASDQEYLDQARLNKYHADWVDSQYKTYDIDSKRHQHAHTELVEKIHTLFPDDIRYPSIGTVLKHLGHSDNYNKINLSIHGIEDFFKMIKYKVKSPDLVEVKNPFPHQGLSHQSANFRLSFHHLGRTLYNKFLSRDLDLRYNDENNYNELLGFVDLSLQSPESIEMSAEYKDWCRSQNRMPLGQYLNLGNILDLDQHLTDYRVVIYRNVLKNNSFSIQLT
jgi:hypothetical protein